MKKISLYSLISLIVLGLLFTLFLFLFSKPQIKFSNSKNFSCPVKIEKRIVRGNSLAPLIKNGQTVKVLFGYYSCHPIQRNDLIIFHYAGRKDPLIKIVKAIPGDKFHLQKTKAGWHILVNNQVLKNSENKPYLLSGKKHKMLSLYEKDYRGRIPKGAYLILGNQVNGTLDSSAFGLVDKSDIIRKAEK